MQVEDTAEDVGSKAEGTADDASKKLQGKAKCASLLPLLSQRLAADSPSLLSCRELYGLSLVLGSWWRPDIDSVTLPVSSGDSGLHLILGTLCCLMCISKYSFP